MEGSQAPHRASPPTSLLGPPLEISRATLIHHALSQARCIAVLGLSGALSRVLPGHIGRCGQNHRSEVSRWLEFTLMRGSRVAPGVVRGGMALRLSSTALASCSSLRPRPTRRVPPHSRKDCFGETDASSARRCNHFGEPSIDIGFDPGDDPLAKVAGSRKPALTHAPIYGRA